MIDWEIWRLVTSPKISASLIEIETEWTMVDVWDAGQVLDVQDDVGILIDLKS